MRKCKPLRRVSGFRVTRFIALLAAQPSRARRWLAALLRQLAAWLGLKTFMPDGAAPANFRARALSSPQVSNIGEEELDRARIETALAIVINHLAQHDERSLSPQIFALAAEAVVNTYVALSTVTTRQGADRLLQALRPVLAEIAKDFVDESLSRAALDEGARLATDFYFHHYPRVLDCGASDAPKTRRRR